MAGSEVLDQLQRNRSSIMDSQGYHHRARFNIWNKYLAVVFCGTDNERNANLGEQQETTTHAGRIQHTMDMVKHDGYSTARIIITIVCVLFLSGCGTIDNCKFNPGVTVEQKSKPKDGEVQKESEIESKLPVKVSPKGEFNCSF